MSKCPLRKYLALVFLTAYCSNELWASGAVPAYEIKPMINISGVAAALHTRILPIFQSSDYSGAIGRSYKCALSAPLDLKTPCFGATHLEANEVGLDIWDACAASQQITDCDVFLTFDVVAKNRTVAYLDIGANDSIVVLVNERIVKCIYGKREFVRGLSMVKLDLQSGNNRIEIVASRSEHWTDVPVNHLHPQWAVSLDLFDAFEAAARFQKSRNKHITDSSICQGENAINLTDPREGEGVFLLGETGNIINTGHQKVNGTVSWESAVTGEGVFLLQTQSGDVEPLLLYDNLQTLEILLKRFKDRIANTLYEERFAALISASYDKKRDYWWSRSVLRVLIGGLEQKQDVEIKSLAKFPAGKLKLFQYRSGIDGSLQYLQYFIPENANSLLVVIPSIGSTNKPFLESAQLDGERDNEDLSDLAENYGFAILWPGLCDVDYGGDFGRVWLDEAIAAVKHVMPPHIPIVPLGTCSSGILALGYAETRGVQGLAFQTPVLERTASRWMAGVPVDKVLYPVEILEREQTLSSIDNVRMTPTFLMFNTRMAGHGDIVNSKWICNYLSQLGADLQCDWTSHGSDFLWGESQRLALIPLAKWLATLPRRLHDGWQNPVVHPQTATVKEALLKGYRVSESGDPVLDNWLKNWTKEVEVYRGKLHLGESNGITIITARVFTQTINEGTIPLGEYKGALVFENKKLDPLKSTPFWGFRMLSQDKVEVSRSLTIPDSLPRIDLLVDGCCKGAYWTWDGAVWQLSQVWN